MIMDVWMDDIRPAPEGWTWVHTVEEVTDLLATGSVEALSLDNDLGPGMTEGYHVVKWLEENGFWPEILCIHTNNAVAGRYMRDVISGTGMYTRPVPVEFGLRLRRRTLRTCSSRQSLISFGLVRRSASLA